MEKAKNKTVAVSVETDKKLHSFCEKYGVKKKDFVEIALNYFQRFGLDPTAELEQPKSELEKISKRVESVITILRAQERDTLKPVLNSVTMSGESMAAQLKELSNLPHLLKQNILAIAHLNKNYYDLRTIILEMSKCVTFDDTAYAELSELIKKLESDEH